MKRITPMLILLLITSISSFCQTKKHSFTNEYANWRGRTDYFNWKVYITGDSIFLASIKQIVYYLDPSFKNPVQTITKISGGKNFVLCTNGWGEFTIRIKIIFTNAKTAALNEVYRLDLHSPSKKKSNYKCP
jgi:transcription initiation factor IIF auxiliary subunit